MFASRLARRFPIRSAVRRLSEEAPKQQGPQRGPVTAQSLSFCAVIGLGAVIYYNVVKEQKLKELTKKTTSVGKPDLGGPFSLVDQDGIPRTDASYHGKMTLYYFGFTHCPDICPSELVKVARIMNGLEKSGAGGVLQPLFISVDPSRDTVGQLRHYKQDFHPAIQYLTGTSDQVGKIARAFRVYFSKVMDADLDSEEDYLVDHSIVLYLVGSKGEFLDFFTQRMEAKEIVEKISEYAKQEGLVKKA